MVASEGFQALDLLNEPYCNVPILLFRLLHCQLSRSRGESVDKKDDVIACIGFHSIASAEAWSCFPYGYGDEESMNIDLQTLRMTTHAPFSKHNVANGQPFAAPAGICVFSLNLLAPPCLNCRLSSFPYHYPRPTGE